MNLHNIHSISRYESKLLRRSWLFRIFALLSLLTIIFFHLTMQGNIWDSRWNMVAMSSSIPFVNIYIYNIAQSIIAIFLAGNFLKRDQKLDTAEVIYVRPLSNADYIVGKTWGIISVFVSLNVIALLIAAFINIFASESPFNLFAYFFYLFTLAIPSLIFILGLSFVIMSLIKNQAVTFVILLGYIGITLFYLGNAEHGAFDFFSITLPNIFSDVTGHPNLSGYLTQRLSYLVLGIGLLTFTISLVKRVPHHPKKRVLLNVLGCLLIGIGVLINFSYILKYRSMDNDRKLYAKTYQKYSGQTNVNLLAEEITYTQARKNLSATANLTVQNREHQNIPSILVYLNPALKVTRISNQGEEIPFDRDAQVIVIKKDLTPYETTRLQIEYEGTIDESICYLDVEDEEFYDTQTGSSILRFGKRYAFIEDEYTLLTPESVWYPTTLPPVNPEIPYNIKKNFTDFSLKVFNPQNKTVISQGTPTRNGDTIIFINKQKLPSLSLAIGDYEKKSVTVDSVLFELYHFPEHDYFTEEFIHLKDTLEPVIEEIKEWYEGRKNRVYPFDKLVLAETPISFTGYVRNWKGYSEFIQPELVFFPERATTLPASNFKVNKERYRMWGQRDPRWKANDTEIEIRVFQDFVNRVLLSETVYEEEGNQLVNSVFQKGWNGTSKLNKYDLASLYFNFSNFISSQDFPIMDILLSTMLKQEENNPMQRWRSQFSGMNDAQRASAFLKDKSFEQGILDRSLSTEVFYEMLKLKGIYLRNYITSQIPSAKFHEFMKKFTSENEFSEVNFTALNDELMKEFNINLMDFIPQWYTINKTPLFITRGVDAEKVEVGDYTKYSVHFKIHNPTEVDGIISINVQEERRGPRRERVTGGQAQEKPLLNYIIPAKSYKEIKILCDNRPRDIAINTNIAQNLPSDMIYWFPKVDKQSDDKTEGIFDTDNSAFEYDPKDIIVDNEDKGFRLIESNQKTTLQSLFKKEENDKYKNLNPWWPPTRWTATVGTNFYGDYINSSYYKKAGSGKNQAVWTAQIEEPGIYEVFVYNANNSPRWGPPQTTLQYYTVKHAEGEEEVSIETQKDNQQWISLGTFYFNSGEATITLNDKGSIPNQIIYADAVRWVFQNNDKNK